MKTLRLILGDQLNINHSWFSKTDENVVYFMAELRQETDYVKHHIQKVVAFFLSMRNFACGARFSQQTQSQVIRRVHDEFHRDVACGHFVNRFPHDAHGPLTEPADEAILASYEVAGLHALPMVSPAWRDQKDPRMSTLLGARSVT